MQQGEFAINTISIHVHFPALLFLNTKKAQL